MMKTKSRNNVMLLFFLKNYCIYVYAAFQKFYSVNKMLIILICLYFSNVDSDMLGWLEKSTRLENHAEFF